MIVEDISKDEVVVRDERKRFFKKRYRLKLSFYDGRSFIRFNPNENLYEIFLSNTNPKRPEELWNNYDLNHEVHHTWEGALFPEWMVGKVFRLIDHQFPSISLEELLKKELENFSNRFSMLRDEEKEELVGAFIEARIFFYNHVKRLDHPQPIAFLNAFEDLMIEAHMGDSHPNVEVSQNFSSNTLRNYILMVEKITEIVSKIFAGRLIMHIFVISRTELEKIYRIYDLSFLSFFKKGSTEKEFYKMYYKALKKFIYKEIPKKAFADRYRAMLELVRVDKILKELKKKSNPSLECR